MSKALTGIRVLDLSRILAGPWATQMLADLGAEVIKVERPGIGDDTRGYGPPFVTDADGRETNESAYYLAANRGKRSITVELGTSEGQAIIRKIAAGADVLVENFKVGGLAKYGLDYASLKVINPRLIYCSISGFGQSGPYKDRAGYDFMIQGMSGLMGITGETAGEPMKAGLAVSDLSTGMYASNAILAALFERTRSGEGQHVDVNLLEVQAALLSYHAMSYLVSGDSPPRVGNAHPNIVPYQAFEASDGYFIVAVGSDDQFRRFAAIIDRFELADDRRFATNRARVANRTELLPQIIERLATRPKAEWLRLFEQAGIPAGPINTIAEMFADPHIVERQFVKTMPHSQGGTVPTLSNPMSFSRSAITYDIGPPVLGEHTDEVLAELGYSKAQIKAFRSGGVT